MTATTVIAFALQSTAFIAALILVLRHNATRQDIHSAQLAALAAQTHTTARLLIEAAQADREKHRLEVQELLQRIQAPEAAVIQHATQTTTPTEAAYPLDDSEQAEAQDAGVAAEMTLKMIREAEQNMADLTAAA